MVTLQTADNALKSFYLDAVSDALNHKINPFMSMIKQTTTDVVGKDVRKVVRYGMNGGVASGDEAGPLPKAQGNNYVQFVAPLKNLYGTIEISDKAIRAAANNEGAFVNILNDEMEGLIKSATFEFGRMLFGPEHPSKYPFELCGANNTMTMPSVSNFTEGMVVHVLNQDFTLNEDIGPRRIAYMDRDNKAISLAGEDIEPYATKGYIVASVDTDKDLTGLEAIFTADFLYGIEREFHPWMTPYVKNNVGDIDENVIQTVIDTMEERYGSSVNIIICSWGVRRALLKYYKDKGIPMQTMEIEGGFKTLSFNGIPVVADRFCPAGTMYLLNTEDFKLCQLCDWQWLEGDDGKILRQIPGKPVYTATLVKYAELICERPGAQAKIIDINEA